MSISVRSLSAVVVALACAAPFASAQPGGFEGVVTFKMSGKGGATEMTQMYKGMKSRTGAMIMDLAAGIMTILMPQQKTYMVVDMQKAAQGPGGLAGRYIKLDGRNAGDVPAMPIIKATGRTEVVAGYTCEYYVMGKKGEAEVCSAKGMGFFAFGQSPLGGVGSMAALTALAANPDYIKLYKDGFFPLKMVVTERGQEFVMEATRVEKKSLDASLFVPPPDYKEMKMPGFGR